MYWRDWETWSRFTFRVNSDTYFFGNKMVWKHESGRFIWHMFYLWMFLDGVVSSVYYTNFSPGSVDDSIKVFKDKEPLINAGFPFFINGYIVAVKGLVRVYNMWLCVCALASLCLMGLGVSVCTSYARAGMYRSGPVSPYRVLIYNYNWNRIPSNTRCTRLGHWSLSQPTLTGPYHGTLAFQFAKQV